MNLKKILASVAAAAMAVSGMTVASFAVDTSAWRVVACVYDGGWDGWKFVESEAGVLTLETTVADLKAKHSAAEGNLGGVAVQVWGGEVGEELEYTVTIGTAVNESGTAAFEKGSGDNSATVGQYSTALNGGAYEFADEDAVVVTVTPVGGVDDEPATDDEPAEDPAEPEDNTTDVTSDDGTEDVGAAPDETDPDRSAPVTDPDAPANGGTDGAGATEPKDNPGTGVVLFAAPAIAAAAGVVVFKKRK